MRRVALEIAACLRFYASRPENGGRLPWLASACADPAVAMRDQFGIAEGRVPDTPFDASAAAGLLPRWWRAQARAPEALDELPTRDDACRLAIGPEDAGPVRSASPGTPADEGATAGLAAPSWWTAWKPFATVALAQGFTPRAMRGPACTPEAGCLEVVDREGRTLATARSAVVAVHRSASCAAPSATCDASGCRMALADGDAAAWLP
jgi:hypothetical protein